MCNKNFLVLCIMHAFCTAQPETREERIAILQKEQEAFIKAEQNYEAKKQAMMAACLVREQPKGQRSLGRYRAFVDDKAQCIACLKTKLLLDAAYETLNPIIIEEMRIKGSTTHEDFLNDINFFGAENILYEYPEEVDRELYFDGFIDKEEYHHRVLRLKRNKKGELDRPLLRFQKSRIH